MDRTLELLSTYACGLIYEALPAEVVHQVKRTLIDTLGCAMGAFHAEPSRIARRLAEGISRGGRRVVRFGRWLLGGLGNRPAHPRIHSRTTSEVPVRESV